MGPWECRHNPHICPDPALLGLQGRDPLCGATWELQGGPKITYKKQPTFSYKVPIADRLLGPAALLDASGARPAWPSPETVRAMTQDASLDPPAPSASFLQPLLCLRSEVMQGVQCPTFRGLATLWWGSSHSGNWQGETEGRTAVCIVLRGKQAVAPQRAPCLGPGKRELSWVHCPYHSFL